VGKIFLKSYLKSIFLKKKEKSLKRNGEKEGREIFIQEVISQKKET